MRLKAMLAGGGGRWLFGGATEPAWLVEYTPTIIISAIISLEITVTSS